MAKKITIDQLVKEINQELSIYSDEVREAVDKATWTEANKSKNRVKRNIKTAGIKKGQAGNYYKSIAARTVEGRLYRKGQVYARAPHYRLTHLLEHGHVIRNKYGTFGRTRSFEHWKPAEQELDASFPGEVIKEINKI